eukprot:TRINITY_DN3204_c0_g1_i1.p1 TRINITY_DN3204_c0_g1~~TRINITY_DN3204_c0_g1_i1.p1  ORF type:complete len:1011 (-),score=162.80 TRINITY_DN3204_c0_g1_i1:2484-5516(-)
MSRTHNPSREQPSPTDAWKQHDAFYAKYKTPAVQQALAVARTNLRPIFIENARFSQQCGLPTVSLSFLIDNLRESDIIPLLTSHSYKLGLQICISPDLTSPLHSPSKNHSDQRIHFDTFVEAFAFSIFCYPIEERCAAFSSAASSPVSDEQQIQCFANNIKTAVHRFIDSSRVDARENIETAQQQVSEVSENGLCANSVYISQNSEVPTQTIPHQHTGHSTEPQQSEERPSTPEQYITEHKSEMKFTGRKAGPRLQNDLDHEHSASQSPANFYTPRCNFPAASPRRMSMNAFPTTPGNLKWFTPRHTVAKLSPEVQKALQMRQANFVASNQSLGSQPTCDSATASLLDVNLELLPSCGGSVTPVADGLHEIRAPTLNNRVDSGVGGNELEALDPKLMADIQEYDALAVSSPESNFQSPELGEGPPSHLQISLEDPLESSRTLLFSESDDENMSDESSRYESDGERSTPALKLSQIEEFGAEIDEPDEVTDFESEGDVAPMGELLAEVDDDVRSLDSLPGREEPCEVSDFGSEGAVAQLGEMAEDMYDVTQSTDSERDHEGEAGGEVPPVKDLQSEKDGASEIDACIDVTRMSPSVLLPDRVETELTIGVESSLFGNECSPGRSDNYRSDVGFDSLGECEHAEPLYNCGNLSESSELSMRTRETFSRMLDSFIENGSFAHDVVSSSVIAEDDFGPSVQCCLNLESIMEDASHEQEDAGSLEPGPQSSPRALEHTILNSLDFSSDGKPRVHGEQLFMDLRLQESGAMGVRKHTTDTVASHASLKTDNEPFGDEMPLTHPKSTDACCEEIVDPHACAPLHESAEKSSMQCASEEAENASVASVMATKEGPDGDEGEVTPEDFNVVRKPMTALASFDPFGSSPLGSVCTKTSEEQRGNRIQSHLLTPPSHRKSQETDQDPAQDSSAGDKRKEQTIIVQCNSHIGENHILAALRENTELCRMLREEVEARRRSDSIFGRSRNFLEAMVIVVVLAWITFAVLDSWMARVKFTKVLM